MAEEGWGAVSESERSEEDSFWVGIPHEAILAIGEDYPDVADYLGRIALVLTQPNAPPPPKAWARRRYLGRLHA